MAKSRPNPYLQRYLRYPLEAVGFWLGLSFFRCLPVDWASNLGGWLGRTIGPRLGLSRRAERNLRLAMPDKSAGEIGTIVRGMWNNLGRVVGEYPHLTAICAPDSGRIEEVHREIMDRARAAGGPIIFVSGHLANWEVMSVYGNRAGLDMATVIRDPNNPHVRRMLDSLRGGWGGRRIPKGGEGSRQAIRILNGGGTLGALIDQKLNDGIAVPFFGQQAMTAPAVARFALRLGCPLIAVRIERLGPGRFRMTWHPPIDLPDSGDKQADTLAVMTELNAMLEDWIRERPAEWLWLHNRWPKAAYQTDTRT